ncbi:3-dehydroquinate dehydratase type I [Catenibacillus scindens]|uniref:Multifunctional fusion protein n=1 Tax=Catenibacillus scindens TaxID=673271 RepID=A0A7W8HA68_9FIRM|nr:3-dehydroquinate dehydratase type I [Catenibacillus scindens]
MNYITVRGVAIGLGIPKICVPVTEASGGDIVKQAGAAAPKADLIEWRADAFEDVFSKASVNHVLKELRTAVGQRPLLFTFRTEAEGGAKIDVDDYIALGEAAVESGCVDLIDVEMDRGEKAVLRLIDKAHERGVFVVGSYHDFSKTPSEEEMFSRLETAAKGGADILKLAVMPEDMNDVLRLLSVTYKASGVFEKPLITMSMGAMGSISRVCGEYFGSAVTFGQSGAASAPGQFKAASLYHALGFLHRQASEIGPDTKLAGGHIFLTGFMGTGKTSVAYALSKKTGLPVIEMDETIVRREGRSIPEIFEKDGEKYFRRVETDLLREISGDRKETFIVSCGGGAVLSEENVGMMKKKGRVILLTADPETVFSRIGGDTGRPNLKNRNTVEDMAALMAQREAKYRAAADHIIETDHKDMDQIASEILQVLSGQEALC